MEPYEPQRFPTEEDLLAPFRGLVVGMLLTIPFWIVVGVVIGIVVSR